MFYLFFFYFCLDSDLSAWIDKVLFYCTSYLSDIAWILRSKNFRFNNLPHFSSAPFPLFCECKDTAFSFPYNTFGKYFSFILNFFIIRWILMLYIRFDDWFFSFYLRISTVFRRFRRVFGDYSEEKYHKSEKNHKNPMRYNGLSSAKWHEKFIHETTRNWHERIIHENTRIGHEKVIWQRVFLHLIN